MFFYRMSYRLSVAIVRLEECGPADIVLFSMFSHSDVNKLLEAYTLLAYVIGEGNIIRNKILIILQQKLL